MFALAAAVSFDDNPALPQRLAAMLDAWPNVVPDGRATHDVQHASTGMLRWAVVARDRRVAPIWYADRQLLIAGDVRLYNRAEIAAATGLSQGWQAEPDLALAGQAFLKWDLDAPRHLRGDFAFVVWDERRRTLFATRDQLGIRPLYYRRVPDGLLVASDVQQLLSLVPRPFDEINGKKILERFARVPRTHGQTYFEGVSQLSPGHRIVFDSRSQTCSRYWSPPFNQTPSRSYPESCHRFRELFHEAVQERLESEYPIIAHSSGGFDSSSVLMMAEGAYSASRANRPPLLTASALTTGMECDDKAYMDAVASRTHFQGIRWSALDPELSIIETPHLSAPGLKRGIGGGPLGEFALARRHGARVLVTGDCGDTVTFAFGILRDLFRHGHLVQLIRETVFRRPLPFAARQLARAVLGCLPPAAALQVILRVSGRSRQSPGWYGPVLRDLSPPPRENLDIPEDVWRSHLGCEMWARISSPQFAASVDSAVVRGSMEGLEVRIPFADVRLVEHLFSVPWDQRIPHGDSRRLAKDALRGLLPDEFQSRIDQGSWSGVWAASARHLFPTTRRLMEDGLWLSAPYIDLARAKSMMADAVLGGTEADPFACVLVAEFGILEAWLRRVFRYDARHEVERCPKS